MDQERFDKLLKQYNLPSDGLADLLEQTLAEREALQQLNRSYRALGEVIKVRELSQSEQELLERTADLLKECCQYKYVWVGYKKDDPQQSIQPVAWSPEARDFVNQVQVSWGDNPLGQGTVGRSLRSLKPVVFEDIPTNPHFAPWRENARHYGFNSVVSIPLLMHNEPFGALVIYSVNGRSFSEQELQLLGEIAKELGAGILLIRKRKALKTAQEELQVLHKAVEQSPVSIVITDRKGLIEYVNPFFSTLTGYSAQEVIGKNPRILNSGKTPKTRIEKLWKAILNGKPWSGEFINRTKDGRDFIEFARIAPVTNEQGQVTHFIGVKEDITRRKKLEESLTHLAHYDQLTQLPNRALFYDRLNQALALAERQQKICALLFIDLNHFKLVNDSFGHETGDALLRACGERLSGAVRESDTVARIGGDEFVIISNLLDKSESARGLAEKIIKVLSRPFQILGNRCDIGASIGISLYPEHGQDRATLINKADQAMYRIKKQGLNAYACCGDWEAKEG